MTEKLNPEDLRSRLLSLLNRVGDAEVLDDEDKDYVNLIHFGIDDLDKTDSLPWEVQREFDVYCPDLVKVETFGELIIHVQELLDSKN